MTTPTSATRDAPAGEVPPAAPRRRRPPSLSLAAWRHFLNVAKPYWLGNEKSKAWGLLLFLVVLMLVETQLAVMLNNQAGEMTSALAGRNASRFWTAVRACLLTLAVAIPVYAFYY